MKANQYTRPIEDTDTVYFERGSLCLPVEALESCSHPGPCDLDVEYWEKEIDWKSQSMNAEDIKDELSEISDWDVSDDLLNRQRILWIAAGNWQDEGAEEDEDK